MALSVRHPKCAFAASNIRNHLRSREPSTDLVCARLGKVHDKPSELFYSDHRLAVFAHSRKGKSKEEGQDRVLVFVGEDMVVAGVFDGYGDAGAFFSAGMADKVAELLINKIQFSNAKWLLVRAALEMVGENVTHQSVMKDGGTTAVLAALMYDGSFSAAAASDSALYTILDEGVMRCFDYSRIFRNGTAIGMHLETYLVGRNFVTDTIDRNGITPDFVEMAYGQLKAGEGLFLVTDGGTKCLDIMIDPQQKTVQDNSGTQDLSEIIGKRRDARTIGSLFRDTVEDRLESERDVLIINGSRARHPVDDDLGLVAVFMK